MKQQITQVLVLTTRRKFDLIYIILSTIKKVIGLEKLILMSLLHQIIMKLCYKNAVYNDRQSFVNQDVNYHSTEKSYLVDKFKNHLVE